MTLFRLENQSLVRGSLTNELETKKSVLRKKLKTKSDIERVLLEIEDDMAGLKKKFREEVKGEFCYRRDIDLSPKTKIFLSAKEQLEWMMNIEMQDLNRRLAIESHAREKLKSSLEQVLAGVVIFQQSSNSKVHL